MEKLEGVGKYSTEIIKSQDVNELLIAIFFRRRVQWATSFIDFRDFRRADIDTNEETESAHNKNFIMALTIDLHHPLLTLKVSAALLAREVTVQYTRIFRIISFHRCIETVSLLKDRNRMIKWNILKIKENYFWNMAYIYKEHKIKYLIFQIKYKKISISFRTNYISIWDKFVNFTI